MTEGAPISQENTKFLGTKERSRDRSRHSAAKTFRVTLGFGVVYGV